MYKRKLRYLSFLFILSLGLTGCRSLNVETAKKEVDEYNKLVNDTLYSYSTSISYSKENKESLLDDLTKDKGIALDTKYNLSRLSKSEKESFKVYMVNMDEYFTSLGASSIREVILLVGSNKTIMNLILVWSNNELVSIERRVVVNA